MGTWQLVNYNMRHDVILNTVTERIKLYNCTEKYSLIKVYKYKTKVTV